MEVNDSDTINDYFLQDLQEAGWEMNDGSGAASFWFYRLANYPVDLCPVTVLSFFNYLKPEREFCREIVLHSLTGAQIAFNFYDL